MNRRRGKTSSRDVEAPGLPPWLRNNPDVAPFELNHTRNGRPGLNVLELSGIENPAAVTAEDPLCLEADTPLGEDEHLLAVTHDGEFYIPLGFAVAQSDKTEIRINRLPQSEVKTAGETGGRGISGALKIYFQKVLAKRMGAEFSYPLLRLAQPNGKQDYQAPVADLAEPRTARVGGTVRCRPDFRLRKHQYGNRTNRPRPQGKI